MWNIDWGSWPNYTNSYHIKWYKWLKNHNMWSILDWSRLSGPSRQYGFLQETYPYRLDLPFLWRVKESDSCKVCVGFLLLDILMGSKPLVKFAKCWNEKRKGRSHSKLQGSHYAQETQAKSQPLSRSPRVALAACGCKMLQGQAKRLWHFGGLPATSNGGNWWW